MVDIRLPNINGTTDRQQLTEIRSYLYQLAQQLQLALGETEQRTQLQEKKLQSVAGKADASAARTAVSQFQTLKSLIIKSADIVDAYYEQIEKMLDLNSKYVAISDFGTFREETSMQLGASHDAIQQNISRMETLTDLVDGIADKYRNQQSYIRYGTVGTTLDDTSLASQTAPGIEIGDYIVLDDGTVQATNKRFARFTAYGLELFGDSKDAPPVAYIKQNKLYIANAEVTGSFKLGGYMISATDGLSFDWVGVS